VDTDILKPDTGYLSVIERPSNIASGVTSRDSDESAIKYTEPVSEGEDNDDDDMGFVYGSVATVDIDKRTGISADQVAEAVAYRERMFHDSVNKSKSHPVAGSSSSGSHTQVDEPKPRSGRHLRNQPATTARGVSIDPLAPSSAFDETLRDRLKAQQDAKDGEEHSDRDEHSGANSDQDQEESLIGDERLLARDWRAPVGKRISVPVRIEPKVYFAAERTFLVSSLPIAVLHVSISSDLCSQKWMNTAVFIGTIATTLLNFTSSDDPRGLISAGMFTACALLAIAYSAIIFVFRTYRLRARRAEGLYYDKYGPTLLCFVLFAAMATNIGLRVAEMIEHPEDV